MHKDGLRNIRIESNREMRNRFDLKRQGSKPRQEVHLHIKC